MSLFCHEIKAQATDSLVSQKKKKKNHVNVINPAQCKKKEKRKKKTFGTKNLKMHPKQVLSYL